jgi:hypothetical protein
VVDLRRVMHRNTAGQRGRSGSGRYVPEPGTRDQEANGYGMARERTRRCPETTGAGRQTCCDRRGFPRLASVAVLGRTMVGRAAGTGLGAARSTA